MAFFLTGDGAKWYKFTQAQVDELGKLNLNRWAPGSFRNSAESFVEHYMKHGDEVGTSSFTQYYNKADAFTQNRRGAQKYKVNGYTEGVYRYVKNGKYVDIAPDGSIVSFGK